MANQKLNEVTTVSSVNINNVKTFLAVMNDNSIQQMSKADMATVLGGLIGITRIAYLGSQVDNKIIISSNSGYVLGAIIHPLNEDRTTELAILRLSNTAGSIVSQTTHVVEKILSTNTGSGFTVSEDGSYINANGYASNKKVILVGISTDFELK